ncbi:MAG: hypothetical protein N2645_23870 [Clostridia bacterium]|nr:hypothetical protein [Clostridia bacterium]
MGSAHVAQWIERHNRLQLIFSRFSYEDTYTWAVQGRVTSSKPVMLVQVQPGSLH